MNLFQLRKYKGFGSRQVFGERIYLQFFSLFGFMSALGKDV